MLKTAQSKSEEYNFDFNTGKPKKNGRLRWTQNTQPLSVNVDVGYISTDVDSPKTDDSMHKF